MNTQYLKDKDNLFGKIHLIIIEKRKENFPMECIFYKALSLFERFLPPVIFIKRLNLFFGKGKYRCFGI